MFLFIGSGKYWVDKLDPFECTHIIYAFAVLDKQTYEMKVFDTWADLDNGGYSTVVGLKRQNPALKTLIALGGWNDSQFSTQYSEMVSDPVLRANFVAKALAFVRQVCIAHITSQNYELIIQITITVWVRWSGFRLGIPRRSWKSRDGQGQFHCSFS